MIFYNLSKQQRNDEFFTKMLWAVSSHIKLRPVAKQNGMVDLKTFYNEVNLHM